VEKSRAMSSAACTRATSAKPTRPTTSSGPAAGACPPGWLAAAVNPEIARPASSRFRATGTQVSGTEERPKQLQGTAIPRPSATITATAKPASNSAASRNPPGTVIGTARRVTTSASAAMMAAATPASAPLGTMRKPAIVAANPGRSLSLPATANRKVPPTTTRQKNSRWLTLLTPPGPPRRHQQLAWVAAIG
jgi:hypothetical protein